MPHVGVIYPEKYRDLNRLIAVVAIAFLRGVLPKLAGS
jgi:hypothetical protein